MKSRSQHRIFRRLVSREIFSALDTQAITCPLNCAVVWRKFHRRQRVSFLRKCSLETMVVRQLSARPRSAHRVTRHHIVVGVDGSKPAATLIGSKQLDEGIDG